MKFNKSKSAVEEFEILSQAILGAFQGYDDDVLATKRLLPLKPTEKIKEKIHWVIHKRRAQEVAERLNQRNTRLNTALAIIGR